MKNAFFDKAKRQITRAAILTSLKGKAAQIKTAAVVGLALAIAAIAVMQFTTSEAAGVAAARATRRSEIVSPSPPAAASFASAAKLASASQLPKPPLRGYVDMHTHPMSHLGFGKKLMHGAPDEGSIIPKGTHGCNPTDFIAKTPGEALGTCAGTHGGWGTDNECGDHLRAAIINYGIDDGFKHKVPPEQNLHGDHPHTGYPTFKYWPHQTSKLHQQMWWEWIKRAHDGGLRVMVALSVNSQLLAKAVNGDSPTSDVPSSDLQIREIKKFVGRHPDFMEVAYSPEDLRRIVGAGKLAVILGMEIDDFGGFNQKFDNPALPAYMIPLVQQGEVKKEIKRIYDLGVRYVFPIHLTNNKLGGTAVYSLMFNFANKHNTGSYLDIQHSTDPSIKYDINFVGNTAGVNNAIMYGLGTALELVGEMPAPCINDISCGLPGKVRCCSPAMGVIKNAMAMDGKWNSYEQTAPGHINKLGLTSLGVYALREMMKLGLIIDLDHMGTKSMDAAIELATRNGGYPVNLGHNGMRKTDGGTERNVDAATALRIGRLGGMFGVGTADMTPDEVIEEYNKVVVAMGNKGEFNVYPGVGTDANGLEPLPKATAGLDTATFYKTHNLTMLRTEGGEWKGGKNWDYTKEGVANYGLMKEFMLDLKTRSGGAAVHDKLWRSAEYFARMWEKCETLSDK